MAAPLANAPSAIGRARFEVLALACSLSLLTYLDRICISRVSEDIQRDLGLSKIEMGFVFSAFTAGYATFLIPVGWLADQWGPRKVILRIVLWWSLFTALTGAVFDFWPESQLAIPLPWGWMAVSWGFATMLVVRFMFGCGEAGVYPTLSTVVRTWFPPTQWALAQGSIFMAARLGGALAPFVIGRLAGTLGWRMAFVVLGAIGIVWAVVFDRLFRNKPADHRNLSSDEAAEMGSPDPPREDGDPPMPWREALLSPAVWALSLVYVNIGSAWSFFPTWQPHYLLEVHDFTFKNSEIWVGLPFLCGAAGSLLGGRLSDLIYGWTKNLRWARTVVGVFGCAGAGACMVAASMAEHTWQAVALFSLASFSNDLLLGPFWATVTDLGGRFTGTLAGWFNMLSSIGSVMFVPLIPWLLEQGFAWEQVLFFMACLWLTAAIAWLSIDTTRPLVPRDAARLDMKHGTGEPMSR